MPSTAFDKVARDYDDIWTRSAAGRSQRATVWRTLDGLFKPGDRVLDLGCGTGEDAVHLISAGIRVTAIDASAEMVRTAGLRGVDSRQLAIEDLGAIDTVFDGAISNFGPFNCVEDLAPVAAELARMIPPGGYVVICLLGRFCLWETVHYLLRGRLMKAFRRWRGHASSSLGVTVYYPRVRDVAAVFRPEFRLLSWEGVGLMIPPSYVRGFSPRAIEKFSSFDKWAAKALLLRSLADHRLLVFKRN